MVLYILFRWSGTPATLSWCSACISVSEGVFLMYPWRERCIPRPPTPLSFYSKLMLLNCGVGENLRVPWTARRSNQSILKEISPEYSLEGLMLKLKLQYFGHLMQRTDSFEKTLMLGKIEGGRRRRRQRMRWLDGITDLMDMSLSSRSQWWTGRAGMLRVHGVAKSRTRLSDWTELTIYFLSSLRTEEEEEQLIHSWFQFACLICWLTKTSFHQGFKADDEEIMYNQIIRGMRRRKPELGKRKKATRLQEFVLFHLDIKIIDE